MSFPLGEDRWGHFTEVHGDFTEMHRDAQRKCKVSQRIEFEIDFEIDFEIEVNFLNLFATKCYFRYAVIK